jgi:hypothetical protein
LVPSFDCICVSVIFRSSDHFLDKPLLGSINISGSTVVVVSSSLFVQVPIFDSITGSLLAVLVVADSDLLTLRTIGTNLTSSTYDFTINLMPLSLSLGDHILTFDVVNDLGFVSEPEDCPLVTTVDPTPTATHVPTTTQSPSPSPYETCFPIFFLWDSPIGLFFDICWRSWQDWLSASFGYSMILRVGNELTNAQHGQPVNLSSIKLTGINISLNAFSVLAVFKVTNSDPMWISRC